MPDQPKEESSEGLLSGLMKQITGSEEGKKSSSFPATLILVGIVVIILSVMGIRMAMAKRKAAKLAYQIRKTEEEREQAKEKEKLAENSTARMTAKEEVKALGHEILQLKARMARRSAAHKAEAERLRAVTSWDDIEVIDGREG